MKDHDEYVTILDVALAEGAKEDGNGSINGSKSINRDTGGTKRSKNGTKGATPKPAQEPAPSSRAPPLTTLRDAAGESRPQNFR